ncbi:alpha/beta fold hydrolase [Dyella sp. C9]|uniref:alpha/beta fold hydrolase n=1 Tax=Dyella sp. C9 TaxID=2202154 RepID=UPI000DEFE36A|nr:alpha/beta hydrolase [Dyella sp. C9]
MTSSDLQLSPIRFQHVDGRRLGYRTAGPADGPAVLLIHALASRSDSWREVAQALAADGHRVIVPDLRGHGRSQRARSYALDEFVQDLAAMLDAWRLPCISVIGHSLGGQLALRLAAQAPARVHRLVLEAAPVPPRDAADAASVAALRGPTGWRRSLRLVGAGRLLRLVCLRQFDLHAARSVLRELRQPMPSWWQSLQRVEATCLLLASDTDGSVSARQQILADALPRASIQRVGDGHHLHREHAEAFLAAVRPFLAPIATTAPAGPAPRRAQLA